ncbi:thiol:disulfide oxidoreductase [Erwinia sp. OLTSP20]|uniref:glutathione binding-like protein n=1 Tax=unclassified Erwinia TaxID=2622719 RepID=UPI000C174A3D|nr:MULTISPECIES: glutathione binding-like protein [unclassified Erwinia]PIJ51497.1 thiol:disulfide oxidoreductase [Erwinia sp. OAMSP11]PIJ68613.1 thiol:disulfide oxidoreductase [Erwinia sp. OLSSP12]PIJ83406.1 thiol:disulfide oxidoreductase [Erwinia sp. OLCASP19]PIJ86239.1 thiol:disulfide oxidoreductase [Erwinia sp. OLMTSP26]PIJ88518.1 thiol:disulfide oxidoreductase [Erwinia sp. OLMDSP33]
MIELYYSATPNGQKIALFLEEAAVPFRVHQIDLNKGEQFTTEFLNIAPNNKIPAIVDHQPVDSGKPVALFESGAILIYLAEKTGKFLSAEWRERANTLQWLFWQTSGLGPASGQNYHFNHVAPQTIPYAIERFQTETHRLYNVLNHQLEQKQSPWVAGDHYSIADMAIWPWINRHEQQRIDLANYPAIHNWFTRIQIRPATQRVIKLTRENQPGDSQFTPF